MKQQTHTPGPWTVTGKDSFQDWQIQAGQESGYAMICTTLPYVDNPEANARLIAASPDLLAALEAHQAHGFGVPISDHPEAVAQRKIYAQIAAAVAKAKGAA